jgi:hypothetical protein
MTPSIYPWPADKVWRGGALDGLPWVLTATELVKLHEAIKRNDDCPEFSIGCNMRSNRKFDRAVSLLKRARLVRFNSHLNRWVAVEKR